MRTPHQHYAQLLKTELALIENQMTKPLWNVISTPFGTSADSPKNPICVFFFSYTYNVRKTCFSIFLLQVELLKNKASEVLFPFLVTQIISVYSSSPSNVDPKDEWCVWKEGVKTLAVWEGSLFFPRLQSVIEISAGRVRLLLLNHRLYMTLKKLSATSWMLLAALQT